MAFYEQRIDAFLDELSSRSATPGGGGASALVGAIAASLAHMVAALTVGKPKYASVEAQMQDILARAAQTRQRFLHLMDEDAAAFRPLAEAYRLPKNTPEERFLRDEVMERALNSAVLPPLAIMEVCAEALALMEACAEYGSVMAVSDAGVAAALIRAASEGAYQNVIVNTHSMQDRGNADALNARADALLTANAANADRVCAYVRAKLQA